MPSTINTVGIAVAGHSDRAGRNALRLCEKVQAAGRRIMVSGMAESLEDRPELAEPNIAQPADLATADIVISLGGDGTLLAQARYAAPRGTPLLGVDQGSFGFLAAEEFEIILQRLDEILTGEFDIERRLMITASVLRDGRTVSTHSGLNDTVIASGCVGRLVRVNIRVDGEQIGNYPADGLIIGTPTGSTAYNLSAGGPIVSPGVESLTITPICSHTLYVRPVVVEPGAVIEINATRRGSPALASLTVDGRDPVDVRPDDAVRVKRADYEARLVRVAADSFYQRLRTKLHWDADR